MSILFSKEDSLLRGYLQLGPHELNALQTGFKGVGGDPISGLLISFRGNGYVTDGLLYLFKKYAKGLSGLKGIDLSGCSLITDHGIKFLCQALEGVTTLAEIIVDGCDKLTENSGIMLSRLQQQNPQLTISMSCTKVNILHSIVVSPLRCPLKGARTEQHVDYKYGHVLILPQPTLKSSFLQYLVTGGNKPRSNNRSSHMQGWSVDDWTVALTDLQQDSSLFEYFFTARPTQVIIPFNANSDLKDIMDHISYTVSRVVAKEKVTCPCSAESVSSYSSRPFMDVHRLDRLTLETDASGQSTIRSLMSTTSTDKAQAQSSDFISKTSLTRSNPRFEVKALPCESDCINLILGVMFDFVSSERFNMDVQEQHGGFVDAIECTSVGSGKVFAFGIEGGWLSEYVPSNDAIFYIEEDGLRREICEQIMEQETTTQSGMYPVVCIQANQMNEVALPYLVSPPEHFLSKMKRAKRWVEMGWMISMQIDKKGKLITLPGVKAESMFISRSPFTEENTSYSIKLEHVTGKMVFGAGSERIKSEAAISKPTHDSVCLLLTFDWLCSRCNMENYRHDDKCATCSFNRPTPGEGKRTFHVQIIVNGVKKDVKVDIQLGDTVEVRVKPDSDDEPAPTTTDDDDKVKKDNSTGKNVTRYLVSFHHKGTQIDHGDIIIQMDKQPAKVVPFIHLETPDDYVILDNYQPSYRHVPYNNKHTVGFTENLDVMDNGEIKYRGPKATKGRGYGHFVAKRCLNKDMLEFEVEVLSMSREKLLGVGLCGPDFPKPNTFLGWSSWSIAFHGENGGVHHHTLHSDTNNEDHIFDVGSVIKVKVVPMNDQTPLKFDDDGDLESQQEVKVEFYRNNTLVHQTVYMILSERLYPAFSMKDTTVQLKNFYAETNTIWESLNNNNTTETQEAEKYPDWQTEFLAVAVSEDSLPSEEMGLVQQQMDIGQWSQLAQVEEAIASLEEKLSHLDLQDQQRYSQLCIVRDNLEQLKQNPQRIIYRAVNLALSEGQEKMQTTIVSALELQQKKLGNVDKIHKGLLDCETAILDKLKVNKVIKVSQLNKDVPSVEKDYIDGRLLDTLLASLHTQGKCLLIDIASDTLLLDAGFSVVLETRLGSVLPTEMKDLGSLVPSISSVSHVWARDTLTENIFSGIPEKKVAEMRTILQDVFGVYVLKCLRKDHTDDLDLYVQAQHLANQTQASMFQYWESNMDQQDFIVMRHTYHFPVTKPADILPLLVATAIKYGRVLLLTSQGVVFQNGAVQSVIILHSVGDHEVIVVESRCYMPDMGDVSAMSKQTPSFVSDYTWNVFCIYTDIIDDCLTRMNIPVLVEKNTPPDLVNASVGCKHNWAYTAGRPIQSVCTLCNNCCDKGANCAWNGIMTDKLRKCGCQTTIVGCQTCGICIPCAQQLWAVRTRLRPFGLMMTEVSQTVEQKGKKPENHDKVETVDQQNLKDPVKHAQIALDPHVYNEVEFLSLDVAEKVLCLKEESAGALIQAYPGRARYIQTLQSLNKTGEEKGFYLRKGDTITVRLSDPLGVTLSSKSEETSEQAALLIEPQYFAKHGREVKVIHETGVVLYDTASPNIPVGQLIACKPMTKDNHKFRVKILKTGVSATIAIGLVPANYVPNRQPGWNSQSIAYHADDGGIFLESGYPTRKTKPATVGDIMELDINFSLNKGWFRKNGEKMIELNLNPNRLGFYPCIGFYSMGEAVQILEKELWIPETEQQRNMTPPAFSTYKYGNLWISPGEKVSITSVGNKYTGWIILHNPKKDQVGFKVQITTSDATEDVFHNILGHKEDWAESLVYTKGRLPTKVTVEWISLESGRNYSVEDMKLLFADIEGQQRSSYQHVLPVVIAKSSESQDSIPTTTDLDPVKANRSMLQMEILKNHRLLESYWVNYDNYLVSVEAYSTSSNFLLRYPKCPTFIYPRIFQMGMKLSAYIDSSNAFYECVVVEVYSGGKSLALEYSPADKNVNMTVCVKTNSKALQFDKFDEKEDTLIPYQTRNTPDSLSKTFIHAPQYLLSKGGKIVQRFMDQEAKSNTLRTVAGCGQVFTRLTVQEHHIWHGAMRVKEWMKTEHRNALYIPLPETLNLDTLMYPKASSMFTDISIHRLCFSSEEMTLLAAIHEDVDWKVPVHFVDVAGAKLSNIKLSLEDKYGDSLIGWTYYTLIATKLLLPSYEKIIESDSSSMSREKIEYLLQQLLQVYSALYSIYSAPWGGIEYVQPSRSRTVSQALVKYDGDVLRDCVTSNPHKESDILILNSEDRVCKAHYMNFSNRYPQETAFSYDYFQPYNTLVSALVWNHAKMKNLPEDFFDKFPNLQCFKIGDLTESMTEFTSIPPGISKAKHLKVIEVTNTAMTSLPDDLFQNPSAISIACTDMAVKTLPTKVLVPSPVETLILSGLQLETIPPELGDLEELENLELCYNPFIDLPDEFVKLTKLRQLHLMGSPWLTLQSKKPAITFDQLMTWFNGYPFYKNFLGQKYIEKLFVDCDLNNNGILDEEELAVFNLQLFFAVKRLGSTDLNDEVTGGIPAVVFKLQSLTELNLDFNAITFVPAAINNLQNLKTLGVSHCPLLESLPGSLGHLPNIEAIQLDSCAMLRTPPHEVVSRGFESVKAYLKRLASGFTECHRTKLMVVGLGGAGKTSLLRALMSKDKKTEDAKSEIPTDGIDIVPWTIESEEGHDITFSTWDFAGQAVYYNTHQFFLSKRAVYLLLWSMRQGYEHAGLDFWLSSICCHAPGTPILVVGTQCDLIPQAEIPEKELMERYPQIVGFHQVSSIIGTGIAELQKNLIDVTLQQGYMGEKIPKVWLNLEKRILVERMTKCNYIKWEEAKQYALEQGIYDEKDVRMCVQLLHDLGTVQYFANDFLREYVVINPQWIVDVMACVVSAQDSPIQKGKGRFYHSDMATVWQDYDPSLHPWLRRLTEDFDLTFPLPKEKVNVVPCLLPGEAPDDLKWPSIKGRPNIRETRMVYRFTYLPSGLFNRAQVRLFQFSDGKTVWKKGSMLSKNGHMALLKQIDNTELVVLVQGPNPENILFLIHEVFESIIEESFNGVSYDLFLPCPDCELKGTAKPDLLNSKLIQRAKDCKAPFLQCYKYFHWISMALLQEKLPTSDLAEFDIQLQQSVVALQDLIDQLVMDVAIIYSPYDIPDSGDKDNLSPFLVRDDIVSWGYSCWCADNMDEVDRKDLIQTVRTCRVLIAFISDSFERDTKCCDIFMNAMETMNKVIIPIQIGKSSEWEQKDLGMKMGSQARKLMALNRPRYEAEEGRRHELKLWLKDIFTDKTKDDSCPDVFLSYARANSRKALMASNRPVTNSVGYGDPRDIKDTLDKDGISCWIDSENIGLEKEGIYSDMAAGIKNSKVMLACISDEYSSSSNCMMELRFGIFNIQLPLVVAIVGTGEHWKETEAAMLLRRAKVSEVYLQKDNPEGYNVIKQHVKEALKTAVLSRKQKSGDDEKPSKDKKKTKEVEKKNTNVIAYQEEFELIQRKFMRNIIGSLNDDLPLPRLILADFVKAVEGGKKSKSKKNAVDSSISSSFGGFTKMIRPRTATRSRDRLQIDPAVFEDDDDDDDHWANESFCIRVLCEHEGGWHLCMEKYPLAFKSREQLERFLRKSAPYLHRVYTLLKQSPINLHCFSSNKGKAYLEWIKDESQGDFVSSMAHIRSSQFKEDSTTEINCLSRCRLPSGKIVWLCKKHQKEEHVVKLSITASASYNTHKVLFTEDKLLLEQIEDSAQYKKLKSIKSTKKAELPAPVPIPSFQTSVQDAEALQRHREDEMRRARDAREKEQRERAEKAKEAEQKESENQQASEKQDNTTTKEQSKLDSDTSPEQSQPNKTAENDSDQKQTKEDSEQHQTLQQISTDKKQEKTTSVDSDTATSNTNEIISTIQDGEGKAMTGKSEQAFNISDGQKTKTASQEENNNSKFKATTRPIRRASEMFDPTSPLHKLSQAISTRTMINTIQSNYSMKQSKSENDNRSLRRRSTVRSQTSSRDKPLLHAGKKGKGEDNFEALAPTLHINTVKNPNSGSTSPASSETNSSKTDDSKSQVKPKRIQVRPREQQRGQGASGARSQFALPKRQGTQSQACVLQ